MSQEPYSLELAELICASHLRLLGKPLVDPALSIEDAAIWLYEDAPFCVLAHDISDDPRFIFANIAAQICFGYPWEELLGLPSRLTAEAPERAERQALLASVAARGFATGYRGLRIARSRRKFWIEDVTVWNLIDADGVYYGQAAAYRRISPYES